MSRLLLLVLASCVPGSDLPVESPVDLPGCAIAPAAPPACGTATSRPGVVSDASAAKAARYDRVFHAALFPTGVNAEVRIPLDDLETRAALEAIADGESATLPADAALDWAKVAGGYGGVGIAADAMRYGTLRDAGAPCAEVEAARDTLRRSLDGLHLAQAITGTPGVIARGFARTDVAGHGQRVTVVPLFDEQGAPLPEEKDNGTWREDQSGQYPEYVWEDSCSRDMFMGWVTGMALSWEVIRADPAFTVELTRLQSDALALAESMMVTRESGFDLEIMDADGRRTFHGILHEESIDRFYVPGGTNGQNAVMALGAMTALATVSGSADVHGYVDDTLLADRRLHELTRDALGTTDFGLVSNYSGYNMNFLGALLAGRYLCDEDARDAVATGTIDELYDRPGASRQPAEQSQALYHVVALLNEGGFWLNGSGDADATILQRLETNLEQFPDAPHYDVWFDLCDDGDDDPDTCVASTGESFTWLGEVARNEVGVTAEPIPIHLRPPSNYYWRSNPYQAAGGGDGSELLPGPDFRFVWWLGQWAR